MDRLSAGRLTAPAVSGYFAAMQWHYELEGKPHGPVSDEEIDRLFTSGQIRPDTLIWREGMSGWASYRTARGGITGPPPLAGYETCSRCGTHFPSSELINLGGGRICADCKPVVLQGMREGVSTAELLTDGLWREGKTLVMNKDAALPARCVKCGVPVNAADFKRKLMWHPPWVYVLILLNLLIYALVALAVRKRATIMVGLCDRHRVRRRWLIAGAWLTALAGAGLMVADLSSAQPSGGPTLLGILMILAAGIIVAVLTRVVAAKRIGKEHVWLSGVHVSLLEPLPEWDGGKE